MDKHESPRDERQECDEMWEWISEFVCWEFCKANAYDSIGETDLVNFFRSMIVKKASKKLEEVQACEAVAKFIEIANIISNEKQSVEFLDQCANLVVRNAHNLQPVTENVMLAIQDYLENDNSIDEQEKVITTIQEFSREAFESLPHPYLLKLKKQTQTNCENSVTLHTQSLLDILNKINVCEDSVRDIRIKINEDKLFQSILHKAISRKNDIQNEVTSSSSEILKICDAELEITKSCDSSEASHQLTSKKKEKPGSDGKKDSDFKSPKSNQGTSGEDSLKTPQRTIPPLPVKLTRISSLSSIASDLNDTSKKDATKRKRNPWTSEEEELLVRGVKTYGLGFWSLIRADGGLERRSVRDLYDKWKNIEKYKHLERIEKRLLDKEKKKRTKEKR